MNVYGNVNKMTSAWDGLLVPDFFQTNTGCIGGKLWDWLVHPFQLKIPAPTAIIESAFQLTFLAIYFAGATHISMLAKE